MPGSGGVLDSPHSEKWESPGRELENCTNSSWVITGKFPLLVSEYVFSIQIYLIFLKKIWILFKLIEV